VIETDRYTCSVELPQDWNLRAEKTWVMGWFLAKDGAIYTDIRGWLDGELYLGLLGMPRPDIEKDRRGYTGLPHAGFLFLLEPRTGGREFRIEALGPEGTWVQIFHTAVTVAPPASGSPAHKAPQLDRFWIPESLYKVLKVSGDPRLIPDRDAIEDLALAASARPLDTLPNPPFFGALEEPDGVTHTQYNKMVLRGWLIHLEQPIRRVYATTHPMEENSLPYGQYREDAVGFHSGHFTKGHCQFRGQVDIRADAHNPICVKIFAELENGERHLAFARRFLQSTCAEKEEHYPVFSNRMFWRALSGLRAAWRRHGVALPAASEFWMMAWRAFRGYGREAPSRAQLQRMEISRAALHQAAPARPAGRSLHVLLITHNFNFEGAPLFLLEYATWLVQETGARLTVLSGQDGPLCALFEELGAIVQLIDEKPIFDAETSGAYQQALAALQATIDWKGIDVVYANTAVCFWGVHLARRAGRPSVLQIHESASIKRFFDHLLVWKMHLQVRDAFRTATRVVFLAEATHAYYADLGEHGNFRIIPGWIDLAAIDRFRAQNTRASLRARHGIRDDELVIANIGTVCERKGQHIFVRALEHFAGSFPHYGKRARFLLVGGRPGLFQDKLVEQIELFGLSDRVTIINETREVYDYYALADLFVCTSFEESFPRVILEAMAFGLPIVTTDVHGIPEIVRHGSEAWLTPPGDPIAFSRLMKHCLDEEAAGRSLAPAAAAKVRRDFAAGVVQPRHASELFAVAASHPNPSGLHR
jgi:glycosyltransferase involved in cell wall biosynthesis